MLLPTTATLLTLITAVSAAVCPPGPTRFRIYPNSRQDLCITVDPNNYNDPNGLGRDYTQAMIQWPNVKLQPCDNSWSQTWEWFVHGGNTMLRNPDQNWPEVMYADDGKPIPRRSPYGMVLGVYEYFFPIANGAGFVLHWYMGSGSVPKENWMYNTDLQLINGYKLDGKQMCMDYNSGDGATPNGHLQWVPCVSNNPNQQWVFDYIKS